MRNDCLTLTVNQAVRHQFFVTRDQVQNLWKETNKCSLAVVNKIKVEKGVSVGAFKEFFVKDNFVYSVIEVAQF
jgi:hypothetical protein